MANGLMSVILIIVIAVAVKKLYVDDFSARPPLATTLNETYDYIVVGAGTAGSVIASRLSEDSDVTVLLLEAGEDDRGNPTVQTPGFAGLLLRSNVDWGYYSEPQENAMKGLQNGRSFWPRGKVIGGCGSINALMHVRGSRHDFDRWAEYTGDKGWNYQHVLPYFKKSESVRIPELSKSEYRGQDGPITIVRPEVPEVASTFRAACKAVGFPDNDDFNGKTMEGISHLQQNAYGGERLSSGRAFVHPALGRPNFDVAIHSHVTKVIINNKRAEGVEVIKEGRKYTIRARKEVILSAGSIGSSQILMLSGVGPKKHLESLKIPVVADLPVGQNLQDHLMFDLGFKITEPLSSTWDDFNSLWIRLQYKLFGTGPLAAAWGLAGISFRGTTKETREKDWPDVQIMLSGMIPGPVITTAFGYSDEVVATMSERMNHKYGMMIVPALLRPESRGSITLNSSDPFDYPVIKANYFDKHEDVDVLIRGLVL